MKNPLVSRRTSRRMRRAQAFTLVELLVVIAIIAVLAALLSPALRSVKERTKQIRCMSTMRQLVAALNLYANENEGWTPAPTQTMDGVNTPWLRVLTAQKYLGGGNIVYGTDPPPPVELAVGRCPAWPHATWSRNTIYGLRTHSSGDLTKHNLAQVRNLSEFGLVFDTITQLVGANFGQQWYRVNPVAQQRIHLRHLGNTNVGFADGSVRCMSTNELIQIENANFTLYGYGYTSSSYYYTGP